MKFYVHRDPNNKLQMIPYVALQMSKLADADGLLLDVGEGTILLSRGEMSTREAMKMVSHLEQMSVDLVKQLTEASYRPSAVRRDAKILWMSLMRMSLRI